MEERLSYCETARRFEVRSATQVRNWERIYLEEGSEALAVERRQHKTLVVQKLRQKYSLNLLLSIAQLPCATFYYHLKQMQKTDKYTSVKEEITTIFHENKGRYGYRWITTVLRSRGFLVNHKTVQRLMKELGLICRIRMKKYRSYKGNVGKVASNLLNRDFHADKPNQKWVTDVTEFSLFGEKLYLSPMVQTSFSIPIKAGSISTSSTSACSGRRASGKA